MADADTLKKDAEARTADKREGGACARGGEKVRKQLAAKAAQAKDGGDAAGPSSPAA